jgi:hypothetical protein
LSFIVDIMRLQRILHGRLRRWRLRARLNF